ncbi:uncharacterized protein BKA78DRAFT_297253 [Phyllosticta capitalensis]|uniref:uncharacterized protein n=1 Tax=Phyllosticta capitalensis TaxID=121624 RepID=UPI00312D6B17
MAPNNTPDGRNSATGAHGDHRHGEHLAGRGLSGPMGKEFPTDLSDTSSSTLKPTLYHSSTNAVPASVETNPIMTPMTIREKGNNPNVPTHYTDLSKASPGGSDDETRIKRDIRANNDLRRRLAVGELQRRIAIEAAVENLDHSHAEAVELIDRLKELKMDLSAFVRTTSDAKERAQKKHASGNSTFGCDQLEKSLWFKQRPMTASLAWLPRTKPCTAALPSKQRLEELHTTLGKSKNTHDAKVFSQPSDIPHGRAEDKKARIDEADTLRLGFIEWPKDVIRLVSKLIKAYSSPEEVKHIAKTRAPTLRLRCPSLDVHPVCVAQALRPSKTPQHDPTGTEPEPQTSSQSVCSPRSLILHPLPLFSLQSLGSNSISTDRGSHCLVYLAFLPKSLEPRRDTQLGTLSSPAALSPDQISTIHSTRKMSHNKARDGNPAATSTHENHGNEDLVNRRGFYAGKQYQLDVPESQQQSMPEPTLSRSIYGERATTSSNLPMKSNNHCKPNGINSPHKQPKTYVQLHPEFASKPTIYIPDPDTKRRMAAADKDLKRRLAIEAAMVNLGHSYNEATILVARLQELEMDLAAFIENTGQAKERSSAGGGPRRRERGMIGRQSMLDVGLGALSINRGKDGVEVKGDTVDGQENEEQGDAEREEWRFWCE